MTAKETLLPAPLVWPDEMEAITGAEKPHGEGDALLFNGPGVAKAKSAALLNVFWQPELK
jgi:hypothetical protein